MNEWINQQINNWTNKLKSDKTKNNLLYAHSSGGQTHSRKTANHNRHMQFISIFFKLF